MTALPADFFDFSSTSNTDFVSKPDFYRRKAQRNPVVVHENGEDDTVLMNVRELDHLRQIYQAYMQLFGFEKLTKDRQSFCIENLPEDLATLLADQSTPDLEDYDY